MHKTSLQSQELQQLRDSLSAFDLVDLTETLGAPGRIIAIDPRRSTITQNHKGWSYTSMILEALNRGDIDERTLIREFTSGRGGEAAAKIAHLLGLESEIVMPENITPEREASLKKLSNLVLTPESDWLLGSMRYAHEASAAEAGSFLVNQSANNDNVKGLASVFSKAVRQVQKKFGEVSYSVSTVGTGGTTSALGKCYPRASINVGIDPQRSPSTKSLKEGWHDRFVHHPHKYWGGGAGAASPLIRDNIQGIDQVRTVQWEAALDLAQWVGRRGLDVGLSTGGNLRAAIDLVNELPGITVVTIIHDTSKAYRSMGL